MNTPLPELLEAYGTRDYYLRKQAGVAGDLSDALSNRIMYGSSGTPLLSKATQLFGELAPPAAFLGVMHHWGHQDARLLAEAEQMNQQMRDVEHARMMGTISAFGGGSASYPGLAIGNEMKVSSVVLKPEVEKVARELGRAMAHEFVKSAGMGQAIQDLGSKAVAGARNLWSSGAARMAGASPSKILTPMRKLKVGLGVAGVGAGMGLMSAGRTAKQYMMTPTAEEHWGAHGPAPRANITAGGY